MRNWLGLVAVLLCVGVATADKPVQGGVVSEGGRYSVVFPTKPSKTDSEKVLATAGGNLTVTTSRSESSSVVYSVTYTDYPMAFKEASAAELLKGVVNGMKGNDGTVSGEADFDVPGGVGRVFTITAGDNLVRGKVALVGNRLYLVQVSGKKDAAKVKPADEFLSSFVISAK
jgi:hypothetical protein